MELHLLITCMYAAFLQTKLPVHFLQDYKPDIIHYNRKKQQTYYYYFEVSVKSFENDFPVVETHIATIPDILKCQQPLARRTINYIQGGGLQIKASNKVSFNNVSLKRAFYDFCKNITQKHNAHELSFYHNSNPGAEFLIDWLSNRLATNITVNNYRMVLPNLSEEIRSSYIDNWANAANRCCLLHRKDTSVCSMYTLQAIHQKFTRESVLQYYSQLQIKPCYIINDCDTIYSDEDEMANTENLFDEIKEENEEQENWENEISIANSSTTIDSANECVGSLFADASTASLIRIKTVNITAPLNIKISYRIENNILYITGERLV